MASKRRLAPSRKAYDGNSVKIRRCRRQIKPGRKFKRQSNKPKTKKSTKIAKKRSAVSILETVRSELKKMIREGKRRLRSPSWVPMPAKPIIQAKPERQYLPTKSSLLETMLSNVFAPSDQNEANLVFLKKSALLGTPDAQYELGIRHVLGLSIPREPSQGVEWLNKAANAEQPDAQLALGYLHEAGKIVTPDLRTATVWYQKRHASGNEEATFNLARCQHIQGNHTAALNLWTELANKGDIRSLNNKGTYLALGIGTPRDCTAAADMFRNAQKNGYSVAEYNLGICYELGEGVKQSDLTAHMLIESSAQRGYSQAQYHLGDCYLTGKIVGTKNHALALKWLNEAREQTPQGVTFDKTYSLDLHLTGEMSARCKNDWVKRAATLGDSDAQSYLGRCYAYGTEAIRQDYPEAIKWLTMAAINDDAAAQYLLGYLYGKGLGVKRDTKLSSEWHRQAAINGIKQSILITACNYYSGIGFKKDEVEAYAYYCASDERYKSAFLERKKYDWKDFKAGECRAHELMQEMSLKRKTN